MGSPIHMHRVNDPELRNIEESLKIHALHPFFENIIQKKVNQVALSHFEKIVDWLCYYLYPSYNKRLILRLVHCLGHGINQMNQPKDPVKKVNAISRRVLFFKDRAPLVDRTSAQRVKIEARKLFDLASRKSIEGYDEIKIDGKPLYFRDDNQNVVHLLFGKKYNTTQVIVTDVKECPELVVIYERETNGNLKAWCVDTTKPTEEATMGGQLVIGTRDVFIADAIKPRALLQAIAKPQIQQSFYSYP
jgi:hypothetical protein